MEALQIGDSNQYLEGTISTWKDHNTNIGVQMDKDSRVVVLLGTDWSSRVETRFPFL